MLALLANVPNDVATEEELLALKNGTLCFPPATEEQVREAEIRLGVRFPQTFRSFLLFSNGFIQPAMGGGSGKILGVAQLDLYSNLYQEKYEIFKNMAVESSDRKYAIYGQAQDEASFRTSCADSLIAISTHDTPSIYLLNPEVVFDDGEFEAWYFNFHSGANRYRTFFELMAAEKIRSTKSYAELVE